MRQPCKGLLLLTLLTPLLLTPTGCGSPNSQDFVMAAANGDTAAVQAALDAGIDVNATDEVGLTALMAASWEGQTATVQALLDAGSDIHAMVVDGQANLLGMTALAFAADGGHAEAAEAFALRMVPPYRAASLNDRDPGPCHTSSYSASVVTGNLLSRV